MTKKERRDLSVACRFLAKQQRNRFAAERAYRRSLAKLAKSAT